MNAIGFSVGCPICGVQIRCTGKAWIYPTPHPGRIEAMDHAPMDEHYASAHPGTTLRWGDSPSYPTTTTEKPPWT